MGIVPMKFTVGLKHKGEVNHVLVDAEDALIAALKAKTEHPEALIMYVRPQNRRGDARHPPLAWMDLSSHHQSHEVCKGHEPAMAAMRRFFLPGHGITCIRGGSWFD
jgi:hypothetical protein